MADALMLARECEEDDKVSALMDLASGAPVAARAYAPRVIAEAYEQFLGGADFDDIAIALAAPRRVVMYWARKYKWLDRKTEIERTGMCAADLAYRRFLAENRGPTAERHLRVAKGIESLIGAEVERLQRYSDDPDLDDESRRDLSVMLRRLSEALASSAGVSARAAGITDRPAPVDGEGGGARGGRAPLVVIGVHPQAVPAADQGLVITQSDTDCFNPHASHEA